MTNGEAKKSVTVNEMASFVQIKRQKSTAFMRSYQEMDNNKKKSYC